MHRTEHFLQLRTCVEIPKRASGTTLIEFFRTEAFQDACSSMAIVMLLPHDAIAHADSLMQQFRGLPKAEQRLGISGI